MTRLHGTLPESFELGLRNRNPAWCVAVPEVIIDGHA